MRRHLLATAVILTVAPGCDNVAWGGVEVRWEPPATAASGAVSDAPAVAADEVTAPAEIAHPLLLAGTREGARATLVVVGELRPEGMSAASTASSAAIAEGSEWILFAEGARVGRLTADQTGLASEYCATTPTLSGTVELVPGATAVERVLALPAGEFRSTPFTELRPLTHDYDQRVASLNFAQEAIPRLGAPWPEGGVLSTRRDIQAFQPLGTERPTVAATYVVRDQLMIGPPSAGAYALLILASPGDSQYRETFEWYHAAGTGGKQAPQYFSHLDWDGDGAGEILLDVFGSDRRWHAVLEPGEGGWVRAFESSCAAPASSGR